ncbi:MAG: T9SS C-terminal target domain-containing protein [Bacteroidetes bacterium]|nr:MAG: T9SS C-terminal target domain-containing protein [Bacteroidota bacterium]
MKPLTLLCLILCCSCFGVYAQDGFEYFDGDSDQYPRIIIQIDTTKKNTWQIGKPQKGYFNTAATQPNAIITDTVGFYPPNDTSRFIARFFSPFGSSGAIRAIQWKQKIDFDAGTDGGMVEFSRDSGITWQNAFNNPNVYKFYGFDSANFDTLAGGEYAFSGTDTSWRDIWLCFQPTASMFGEPLLVRFTLLSDSIHNDKEGWMIDNFQDHATVIHTVVNQEKFASYFKIYPNPTNDFLYLEAEKTPASDAIEQLQLCDAVGQQLEEWADVPTKFFIDVRKYKAGMYYLKIKTNLQSKNYRFIIQRN